MPAPYRVVITGLGCVSPFGIGYGLFYDGILAGRSALGPLAMTQTEDLPCQVVAAVPEFDETAWLGSQTRRMLPRTVPLAIAAASEALADAALDPQQLDRDACRRFGVIIGSGGGSIELTERQYAQFFQPDQADTISVYAVPAGTMGSLSSEISMYFQLRGASHVISTGCTSATDALGYAFQQIQAGRLDRAICGGVDASITPGVLAGFCRMRVVSSRWNHEPQAASRPFSYDRDGFVLGEGAWLFILERADLAARRGARPYAELRGYGSTCDAYHRVRMDESGEETARAIQLALEEAAIGPEALDYVSMHGTATVLNDRVETQALRLALGRHAYRVPASSIKSMIGHPQGASGAAGVAATVSAMRASQLPPTINLRQPDPFCDLDYVPEIGRKTQIEWALCNCLGFGSKNSALVLQRVGAA